MTGEQTPQIKFAMVWSFVQRCSQQGLHFGLTLVMVRLLSPDDYGLLGMTIIFTALSKKLVDAGFSSALVQKKEITPSDCHTAFYTNLGMSLAIYAVLFVAAPAIAKFYEQPVLTALIRFNALGVIIGAFSAIQLVLYTRDLDFKTPTRLSLIAMIVGGVSGIAAALQGLGVWSLAIQAGVTGIVKCILVWRLGNYRPALVYSVDSLKALFSFGSKVSFMSMVETLFTHLHDAIIGKLFTPAILGFYGRGKSLVDFSMMNVVQPMNLVIYPAMSRVQDSAKELKALHLRSLSLLGFLIIPTMTLLACLAEPLVKTLLTEKWIDSVPYLRLLCLIGALVPIRKACTTALKASNNVNTAIRLQMISRLASLAVLAVSVRYGIEGMIIGEAATLAVFGLMYMHEVGKRIEAGVGEQLASMLATTIPSLCAATVVLLTQLWLQTNAFIELATLGLLGATTYLLVCFLMGNESLREIATLAQSMAGRAGRRKQVA